MLRGVRYWQLKWETFYNEPLLADRAKRLAKSAREWWLLWVQLSFAWECYKMRQMFTQWRVQLATTKDALTASLAPTIFTMSHRKQEGISIDEDINLFPLSVAAHFSARTRPPLSAAQG